MSIWAIVPVKPLRRGKSRLASVLSEDDRAALNERMLIHTIDTLKSVPELGEVLVVSRDPAALAIAREHGARTLQEDGAPHLNVALTRATAVAQTYTATSVLVVPADLPQLSPADLSAMLQAGKEGPAVVIAPDHHHEGTNALYVNPAGLVQYQFGEGSFQAHSAAAATAGARLHVLELLSLSHDVDVPEDLDFLQLSDVNKGATNEVV
ncbi:MAG: 2-phospho-L-lactate guanylyltransferase [Anaerolineales bacterium]|nr:2-phospho-L-lactate guanylyltransferase [Anaerolineales bacterium]